MAEIISATKFIQTVNPVVLPNSGGNVAQDFQANFMDRILDAINGIERIMDKSTQMESMIQGIISRKSVTSREENKPPNPVLVEKQNEKDYVDATKPELPGEEKKPVPVPTPEPVPEKKEEEIIMLDMEKVFPEVVAEAKEKTPDKYKDMTLRELIKEYEDSGQIVKTVIHNFVGSFLGELINANTQKEKSA